MSTNLKPKGDLWRFKFPLCFLCVNAVARDAVPALNVDGFYVLDENTATVFWCVVSTYRHRIQLKLSQETFNVSFLIIWSLNKHYIDPN